MADSSDDSDNFNETIEIPYSKRPEWADIQPILQVLIRLLVFQIEFKCINFIFIIRTTKQMIL